jgi:hypothetical protein
MLFRFLRIRRRLMSGFHHVWEGRIQRLVSRLILNLGAFAKLRKASFGFVMSVRPSVRMKQLGSYWTDFHEIDIWIFFENLSKKFKFLWSLTIIIGTLLEGPCTCMIVPAEFSSEWEKFQTKFVQKSKHILCSITFSRKSYRLGDIVEKYGSPKQATDDNITWSMRFACWITKATHTRARSVLNTYCFSTTTTLSWRHLSVRYTVRSLLPLFISSTFWVDR